MKLVAYIDESGTHDPLGRRATGGREAGIGGLCGLLEEWGYFTRDWQSLLSKYRVPYFHFYEWSMAFHDLKKGTSKPSGPYGHLDKDQLDRMVIDFAKVAGAGNKVIVGEGVCVNIFNEEQEAGIIPKESNPYCACARKFFERFTETLALFKPVWRRTSVDFFFDQTDNREFSNAILAAFHDLKVSNHNFGTLAFADKTKELPLQAADMVAYRARQLSQNFVDGTIRANWEELDSALFRPMYSAFDNNPKLLKQCYGASAAHERMLGFRNRKRPGVAHS